MDSRRVLVRENVRAPPPEPLERPGSDQENLLYTMAETHLEVNALPAAAAQPAAVDCHTRVYRPYESGGVLLAADGAMEVTLDGDRAGTTTG